MPCVSIIVPVYKVEKYLSRCLDSLCNQTLKDIEIICIDDCSPDNSLQILKEYALKDSRIKVIALEKNSGAAVARNKGLEIATGEYLGFVDPDDEVELNYYEALYNKAKETGAEVVKCERRTFETNGNISYTHLNEKIKKRGDFYFSFEWTTAIYKSSLISNNNIIFPPELIKDEDVAFLNKVMLKKTTPLEFVDGVYYNYYRRDDSLNAKNISIKSVKSALLSVKMRLEDLNSSCVYEEFKSLYFDAFKLRLTTILGCTLFQNKTNESRLLCAESIIECFNMCKDKELLAQVFPYKYILPYIQNNEPKKLAKVLAKYKNPSELWEKPLTFAQKIFSVKNSQDKKHKIIRILGVKLSLNKERIK